MKKILLSFFVFCSLFAKAQQIDSIYANLYTDSLKKGTYNYINIDGLLSNGRYLPLDSTKIIFSASAGKFYGNSLWIDRDFKQEKVYIKAVLRSNPAVYKEIVIYIKKKENDEKLKTVDDILKDAQQPKGKKNKGKK